MNKHVAITSVDLDPETAALLKKEAAERGIAPGDLASYAIRCWIEDEAAAIAWIERDPDFEAFVQEGEDAIERGDTVPHEVVMAKLERMRAEFEARCRD